MDALIPFLGNLTYRDRHERAQAVLAALWDAGMGIETGKENAEG